MILKPLERKIKFSRYAHLIMASPSGGAAGGGVGGAPGGGVGGALGGGVISPPAGAGNVALPPNILTPFKGLGTDGQIARIQTQPNAPGGIALVADWIPFTQNSPAAQNVIARILMASEGSGGLNYPNPLTPFLCSPEMLPQAQGVPIVAGNNILDPATGLVLQAYLGVQASAPGNSSIIFTAPDLQQGLIVPPGWFVRFTTRGGLPAANVIETVAILFRRQQI